MFFGYIRVSTPRQGERRVSLQEQRAAIERFASRNNLTIQRWFEERETAAKVGRTQWTEMLRLLRRGKAEGVIIHKIDRSARNLRDWADLVELVDGSVQVHFVNESLDLQSRGGRLSADIQAVVAADYIRNLREETLKGIQGRLRQGLLPLPAPIGYLDRGSGKAKAIDPVRSPLVRRAFELYASGRCNLHALREEMAKAGLRNRRGGNVSVNGLSTMLRNPFYIGLIRIRRRNEVYEGAHAPLIPKSLFDRVQRVLDGKLAARPETHDFLFRRTLRCKGCRYALIGERQKGHIYYRCHTRSCTTTGVREEKVEEPLVILLHALRLSPAERTYLRVKIAALGATCQSEAEEQRQAIELQLSQLEARRNRLTDALIDGLLDRGLFEERKAALLGERRLLEERRTALTERANTGPQRIEEFLERVDSAHLLYQMGTTEEKRQIVAQLTSNWTVQGKSVEFTASPEVRVIAERREINVGRAKRVSPRTLDRLLKKLAKLLTLAPEPYEEVA